MSNKERNGNEGQHIKKKSNNRLFQNSFGEFKQVGKYLKNVKWQIQQKSNCTSFNKS